MKKGLAGKTLEDLPAGSVVGTSSIRRTAQLARRYPHLKVANVRGNIGTRIAKLDAEDSPYTCVILAAAGLLRLGLGERISQYLDSTNGGILYAVGQGALGIEIRKNDTDMLRILHEVGDADTSLTCLAERSLLRTLEGGCSAPLGVETEWVLQHDGVKKLRMKAVVVSVDGSESADIDISKTVESPVAAESFGVDAAKELIANGAGKILDAIQQNKKAAAA